jgi:hypothetical protein
VLPGKSGFGFYPTAAKPFAKNPWPYCLPHSESDPFGHTSTYSQVMAYILGRNVAAGGAGCVLSVGQFLWFAAGGNTMTVRLYVYVILVGLAVFNGVFSPQSFLVFALQGIWYPAILPMPLTQMFFLSGAISGLLHLLITGIPAALFEKFVSTDRTSSGLLWLGIMLLPTYQSFRHLGWV